MVELEFSGAGVNMHLTDEGAAAVNDRFNIVSSSFNPNTGFFRIETEEVERNDNDSNGSIDNSEVRHFFISGILMRDPGITNGVDGAPLVEMSDYGSQRWYAGDVDAGGTPNFAQRERTFFYGKRLLTSGSTRTARVRQANQTDLTQILVGLDNPPLKRSDANSKLYLEVRNGGGTLLCSAPYVHDGATDGRFISVSHMGYTGTQPDFNAQAFRGNQYSFVNCSNAPGTVVDLGSYTVRIVDTGPNGVNDGGTGDDVIVFTTAYTASVVLSGERFTQTPHVPDISVNGGTASISTNGNIVPLYGYFDYSENITVNWPAIAGANRYQLRAQPGTGVDDYEMYRFVSDTPTATIPANTLDDGDVRLRVVAVKDTTTNGAWALATSRHLLIKHGIRGLFNIELGSALSLSHQTFQVWVEGDEFGAFCVNPGVWPLQCTAASVDTATDTVRLTMQDTAGEIGGTFYLDLHFTSGSQTAEVTSPNSIPGVPAATGGTSTAAATVANTEFYLRTIRLSHNSAERTQLKVANALVALYTQAVLSREDGAAFGTGVTSINLWSDFTGYTNIATEYTEVPTNDGIAQGTKHMATRTTFDWFGSNSVLSPGVYLVSLTDPSGIYPPIELRYNYTAPSAADYVAPSQTTVILDGVNDCGSVTCNNPASPVSVSAAPDLSWTIDSAVPPGSYWRIVFRPTDSSGTAASELFGQIRTPFMANGDFGLSISGSTATWTNPGSLVLPAGMYEVMFYVIDSDTGLTSTVQGRTTGAGGVGGDLLYITVPGV